MAEVVLSGFSLPSIYRWMGDVGLELDARCEMMTIQTVRSVAGLQFTYIHSSWQYDHQARHGAGTLRTKPSKSKRH